MKYLVNFKVRRHQKVVRQWETDLASLRPIATVPNVSKTDDIQSLRSYVGEQREQIQQVLGVCRRIIGD